MIAVTRIITLLELVANIVIRHERKIHNNNYIVIRHERKIHNNNNYYYYYYYYYYYKVFNKNKYFRSKRLKIMRFYNQLYNTV